MFATRTDYECPVILVWRVLRMSVLKKAIHQMEILTLNRPPSTRDHQGPFLHKDCLSKYRNSHKDRQSCGCLIFMMVIPIPAKVVLILKQESGSRPSNSISIKFEIQFRIQSKFGVL